MKRKYYSTLVSSRRQAISWRTHSCVPRRHSWRRELAFGCGFAAVWGRISFCGGFVTRLDRPTANRPQLTKLPHKTLAVLGAGELNDIGLQTCPTESRFL